MRTSERMSAALLTAVAWSGLVLQFYLSVRLSQSRGHGLGWAIVTYLGFFTILTNAFVAVVSTAPLVCPDGWFVRRSVRGCAVMSIAGVGIGYHLLLRHVWDPQGLQRVADIILHYVVPMGAVIWWTVFPPRKVSWQWPLGWCLWPLAYLGYALVRGEILGRYPYYFIDVDKLGWATVMRNVGGLALLWPVLGCAVAGLAVLSAKVTRNP